MYRWFTPLKELAGRIKQNLYYTKAERRGLILLSAITLVFLLLPYFLPWIFPKKEEDMAWYAVRAGKLGNQETPYPEAASAQGALFPFNPNDAAKEDFIALGLPEFLAVRIIRYREKGGKFYKKEDFKKIYGLSPDQYAQLEPYITLTTGNTPAQRGKTPGESPGIVFNFDPNTVSEVDMRKLGFPPRVIQNIVKYRQKGGQFKKKEDLARIFGMPEDLYKKLEEYIDLSKPETSRQQAATFPATKNPAVDDVPARREIRLDINKATVEEWDQLPGIGPAYAKKIVGFRERLGGFYAVKQVKETYGLPDSVFQKIEASLLSSVAYRKLSVNTISLEELKKHPYLKWGQASAIINYRGQHGRYQSMDDLYKVLALTRQEVDKISPYIDFE